MLHASSKFHGVLKWSGKCWFPAMSAPLDSFDGDDNTKMKITSRELLLIDSKEP
jgi:hypothetical protein